MKADLTKATPGPWTFKHSPFENEGDFPHHLSVYSKTSTGLEFVAEVNIVLNGQVDRGKNRANARLIAAAPELLGALRDLV